MKFGIEGWPYPKDVPACLYWLTSPKPTGDNKDLKMKGLFIGEDGIMFQSDTSWGELPRLKLGAMYVNGLISDIPASGKESSFKLGENVTIEVISSCENIELDWLDEVKKHSSKYLWERYVKIMDGKDCLLMVPCIEVVRTFFAINARLSHLLLEPHGINGISTSRIENNTVEIDFNDKIAANLLDEVTVARIASILYDEKWINRWEQVSSRSVSNTINTKTGPIDYFKIYCEPPMVQNCSWRVRGFQTARGFFVMQILGIKSKEDSPFSEVIWTHPDATESERNTPPNNPGEGESGNETSRKTARGDGETDSDSGSPKGLTRPVVMPIDVANLVFGNVINVIKVPRKKESSPRPHKTGFPTPSGEPPEVVPTKPQVVTVNDERGTGTIKAADFLPIDKLVDIPPELEKFIKAAGEIKNAKVGCEIKLIPKDSKLTKYLEKSGNYALVHVITPETANYILEVASLNGHGMSTLVFSPPEKTTGSEAAVTLLTKCLSSSGNWDSSALSANNIVKYVLVKHVDKNNLAEHWGNKLLAAVKSLKFIINK